MPLEHTLERIAGPLVLVVDADAVEALTYSLQREGYRTASATTGRDALQRCREQPLPDLVLLDIMLPDISGMEVCRQLRLEPNLRKLVIIMLTARSEEIDRVVAFELGADDYVTKPCSTRELMLRARAALRRSREEKRTDTSKRGRFGKLSIHIDAHKVWVADSEVNLTALEFKLLSLLFDQRGRVQTRTMLLEQVWGSDTHITTRTVDTHVKRLRIKLGDAASYLETIRGVGYRLRASPGD